MPGFSRKYNADCMMCHFPVIPHLNNFGQRFRRMGYRTKIEFNKDQDMTNVNNYLSAKVRAQFSYNNTKGQIERTQFQFPEASLYYIGPVSRNFSAYAHLLATPTSGGQTLDFHGDFMGVWGSPENMFMFRIGQMHMLSQKGVGGFDRPIGVNIIPINSQALTSTGSPEVYNFDIRQTGAEFAYAHGPGKLAFQISNGLNNTGSGNQQIGDQDSAKDYMVYYEHLLDELASGFTLFYYNGTTHGTVTPANSATPTAVGNQFNYSRLGFDVSKWFQVGDLGFVSLQGGYVRSHDNNPATVGPDVDGNAFYVESAQYITGLEATFYERFTNIDLNVDRDNSLVKVYTVGVVKPLQTWVRISADYTYTDNRFTGITSQMALLEFQINY